MQFTKKAYGPELLPGNAKEAFRLLQNVYLLQNVTIYVGLIQVRLLRSDNKKITCTGRERSNKYFGSKLLPAQHLTTINIDQLWPQ